MTCDCDIFSCIQCGDCCKGFGGTYLSKNDMLAIAGHLGISESELLEKYCVMSGKRPILRQRSDGYCVFFDRNCSIHPVKPQMCRKWPFIESILVDTINWQIMADSCPGMQRDVEPERLICCVRSQLQKSSKGL
jgi:Fe-S-cluster containining protein